MFLSEDEQFLELALEQAKKSVEQGGFPAGSVIVQNRKIIAKGVSLGSKLNDPTGHAETTSIREASRKSQTADLTGATLYASLQPCLMCFSVANWSGIKRIVFGCRKTSEMIEKGFYEGATDIIQVNKENNRQIEIEYLPKFENKILDLLRSWESELKEK
ncbi:nucleoside deaminase [Candidatus Parcubacteria bacterium]|nr:nucleoside deaminase [Candidatus Parcubacteria bacterium]